MKWLFVKYWQSLTTPGYLLSIKVSSIGWIFKFNQISSKWSKQIHQIDDFHKKFQSFYPHLGEELDYKHFSHSGDEFHQSDWFHEGEGFNQEYEVHQEDEIN